VLALPVDQAGDVVDQPEGKEEDVLRERRRRAAGRTGDDQVALEDPRTGGAVEAGVVAMNPAQVGGVAEPVVEIGGENGDVDIPQSGGYARRVGRRMMHKRGRGERVAKGGEMVGRVLDRRKHGVNRPHCRPVLVVARCFWHRSATADKLHQAALRRIADHAEPVGNDVRRERGRQDREAGKDRDPPGPFQIQPALGDHGSPVDAGTLQADAEEA
jgi:hypothetical protein